ncbi:hypothetical protein [Rhizobium sp. BK176]|uniref:hypothetical protein n=1 Tax=Rhizobium sp. BK176 TaxID=2587071 RepID=UPI00216A5734|nr:hypothetical protein [Rhizobium sp. BK176]MCS4088791.1 hypothetical protein [Rhizobium sp. BK176]
MLLLGNIDKGYTPGESDYTLPDGRVVGPFESAYARELFGHWFSKKSGRLFSALDLFEGTIAGDEYRLVHTDEVSLEMHPFREIYDIWLEGDNGQVVFEMPVGFAVVDPRRLVMVDSPEICERERTLRPASAPPAKLDIERSDKPAFEGNSKHHGEIVVINTGSKHGYVVGWRPDSRHLKDIVGLSRHDHWQTAKRAAERATREYVPLVTKRTNRPYDMQREALYMWEHSFEADNRHFSDISEAQELAARICTDLGITPPTVSLGRATLVTRSYYRLGQVVLNRGMLDSHTVVHEVAHHVVTRLRLPKEGGHGPVFAGTLLALMTEYMGADRETAIDNARDRGIVVNTDVESKLANVIDRRRQNSVEAPSPTV